MLHRVWQRSGECELVHAWLMFFRCSESTALTSLSAALGVKSGEVKNEENLSKAPPRSRKAAEEAAESFGHAMSKKKQVSSLSVKALEDPPRSARKEEKLPSSG